MEYTYSARAGGVIEFLPAILRQLRKSKPYALFALLECTFHDVCILQKVEYLCTCP
ncbi:protein of unknown function [Nitrospira japonica]|uniref:Uncharacterized protein n=1 Tax=Nitrospira japonica TaxID=1325564 RepID=A0A1W1IAC0_9BACT|nr:protein of unknown function [Nitrospira japonica]